MQRKVTATGSGLFRRHSTSQQSTSPPSTPTITPEATNEPRGRHGSTPLAAAFGLARRGSAIASTSNAAAPRRHSTLELPSSAPRNMSESGTTPKPLPLSPKRKPLPKGSAFEKQDAPQDEVLNGKMGKIDLPGGSTMVSSWASPLY